MKKINEQEREIDDVLCREEGRLHSDNFPQFPHFPETVSISF